MLSIHLSQHFEQISVGEILSFITSIVAFGGIIWWNLTSFLAQFPVCILEPIILPTR